ncbi:MAG: hypothetical protein B7Z72_00485 [Gemmatimonadetes bacterium 21-71-4]|nr:MAG: hypothetical protein B7Z72_00485 [Gemmatimonadetes bacterium 21-71-4]
MGQAPGDDAGDEVHALRIHDVGVGGEQELRRGAGGLRERQHPGRDARVFEHLGRHREVGILRQHHEHRGAFDEGQGFLVRTRRMQMDVIPHAALGRQRLEGRPVVIRHRAHELDREFVGPQATRFDHACGGAEQRSGIPVQVDRSGVGNRETAAFGNPAVRRRPARALRCEVESVGHRDDPGRLTGIPPLHRVSGRHGVRHHERRFAHDPSLGPRGAHQPERTGRVLGQALDQTPRIAQIQHERHAPPSRHRAHGRVPEVRRPAADHGRVPALAQQGVANARRASPPGRLASHLGPGMIHARQVPPLAHPRRFGARTRAGAPRRRPDAGKRSRIRAPAAYQVAHRSPQGVRDAFQPRRII